MDHPLHELSTDKPILICVGRLAKLFMDGSSESIDRSRLILPSIQRSLVWRNEKIVDYWDSLFRGYPAGHMMVHAAQDHGKGNNADLTTVATRATDFELFDGQQRLMTILLGLGRGPLAKSRRLWVDLGATEVSDDRKFEIRINSTGQPFGYKAATPNEKMPVDERRKKRGTFGHKLASEVFDELKLECGAPLIGAKFVVPLELLLGVAENDPILIDWALKTGVGIEDLIRRLREIKKALECKVVMQAFDRSIVTDGNGRFFKRVGQGGVPLSNDELTYSLIKNSYPELRENMDGVVNRIGRVASQTDLVLAVLRVTLVCKGNHLKPWEKTPRPGPKVVQELQHSQVEGWFKGWIAPSENNSRRLEEHLSKVILVLRFHPEWNPRGLPHMLLARLPRDLLDVLVYFALIEGHSWEKPNREALIAFVLHWLVFVSDDGKAARCFFERALTEPVSCEPLNLLQVIRAFRANCVVRQAPEPGDWAALHAEVENRGAILATWEKRFSAADDEKRELAPGLGLRVISTHPETQYRLLMWTQRGYLTDKNQDYDPTSAHDEDLPYDLDHLIPSTYFGFVWEEKYGKLIHNDTVRDGFKYRRRTIGNTLGNLRWLEQSDNRSRQHTILVKEADIPRQDLIEDYPLWNKLVCPTPWDEEAVELFQRLIDRRTLALVRKYMTDSGIEELLWPRPAFPDS